VRKKMVRAHRRNAREFRDRQCLAVTLWISSTDRPVPADTKSGLHFCFAAPTPRSVEAFHAAALSNGGRDNGTPGVRADYSPDYFAAFVIDPDGYRLEAHCNSSAA
jgi:catechol 2,3-dioxygenase-like lactoylglutathione lyase family enzyme